MMREFEKCGPIVNHVSGPGGANWVHIQYQVISLLSLSLVLVSPILLTSLYFFMSSSRSSCLQCAGGDWSMCML